LLLAAYLTAAAWVSAFFLFGGVHYFPPSELNGRLTFKSLAGANFRASMPQMASAFVKARTIAWAGSMQSTLVAVTF
jgi:hypothetical protein